MGLDIVEYIVAIEEAFELDLPDADVAHLVTPAQLIDYLCARLGEAHSGPPLVQSAFYWLRRGLAEELAVPRLTICPASTIARLTDRAEAEVWAAVARRLAVNPKFLTHSPLPRWLARLVRDADRTVGRVAEDLAMFHPAAFRRGAGGWTRAQVMEVVLRLLEYEIGIAVTPTQLHYTFVGDLGMG